MPENEFEKKVSSEMQDLRFKPSESVWLRVEDRIKKKKNRRVFVVIFLLAGLALLGYWQRSNLFGGKENNIAATEKQKNENSEPEETDNTSTVKENKEVISKEHMNDTPGTTENEKLKGERSASDKRDISISKKETDVEEKNRNANDVKKLVVSKTKIDNKPEGSV